MKEGIITSHGSRKCLCHDGSAYLEGCRRQMCPLRLLSSRNYLQPSDTTMDIEMAIREEIQLIFTRQTRPMLVDRTITGAGGEYRDRTRSGVDRSRGQDERWKENERIRSYVETIFAETRTPCWEEFLPFVSVTSRAKSQKLWTAIRLLQKEGNSESATDSDRVSAVVLLFVLRPK